ncbi:MAG: hypothetical protein M1832_001590 [Thelocarpon impressellum]|nr:MAG: hypothetical protein M1832_001590 [Thelocarpon impressellum]
MPLPFPYPLSVPAPWTEPKGAYPSGNSLFRPGLAEMVPRGEEFTIKWTPTTPDHTVTLLLLRGPSENVRPLHAIAERVPNSGEHRWTPAADLEPDTTHYGIQLVDDETGAYQYTSQFGVGED